MDPQNKSPRAVYKTVVSRIFLSLYLLLALVLFFAAVWYLGIYGNTGFDSILYTLLTKMDGVQVDLVKSYLNLGLSPALIIWAVLTLLLFIPWRKRLMLTLFGKIKCAVFPLSKKAANIFIASVSSLLIIIASVISGLLEFAYYNINPSTLYEEYYVDPASVKITFPEEKRNLIFIYLESMETTYLSAELGGGTENNLIPELYSLAENNTNFSHNDSVGGAYSISGATWTIASMVAHTSGLPLKPPPGVGTNSYGEDDSEFLPGATSITSILDKAGYYQTLMVGSDADFGGRKQYYTQHGLDRVYDLYTAREDGIIPEDYYVWWGFDDHYLFQYAKEELGKISKRDEPFSFTMLTVDTHHIDGYRCPYCDDDYSEQYENVISCSSRQVYNFVKWIEKQDFYENTTIVIVGDHQTMDSEYIKRNVDKNYERHMYNCIINAPVETDNTKNRHFGAIDMFPTTLAAIGCTIEGDRLGLGTNLYSERKTLIEEMGYKKFNSSLARASEFYIKNFYFAE